MPARYHHQYGQTLIEVILVTFLFGVLGTGLAATLVTSAQSSKRGIEHVVASGYIKEGIEAVRSIRDRDWSEIVSGAHGLTTVDGYYDFAGTSDSLGEDVYTRTITIEEVYRDGSLNGDISASGTVLDAAMRRVSVNVTWLGTDGNIKNLDGVFYVSNWDQAAWVQTLTADFEIGSENSTDITTQTNGEIVLRSHNSDWDDIESLYHLDLVGGGNRIAIYADPVSDVLYVLADTNIGPDFDAIDISDVSENPPTVIASYEISEAEDFSVQDGYAYIVGDVTGLEAEVVILEVPSMTLVSTIDLPESASARGVNLDLYDHTLVIVRWFDDDQDEVVFYDVTNPSAPILLGGADVDITLNDVAYNGEYAFAIADDDAQEVTVIRQSDFAVIDTLDLAGSGNAEAIDMVGSHVYVGRDNGVDDLVRIDASDPAGAGLSVTAALEVTQDIQRLQIDSDARYLHAATREDDEDVIVVDLSAFAQVNAGDAPDGGDAVSVSVFGAHNYIGNTFDSQDATVFRVSPGGWSDATLIGSGDPSGNHDESSIWVSGNYAYLATENNGANPDFFIYDITTPSSPTYLGSVDTNSDVHDVIVSGNYAFLATKDNAREVIVIDVTVKTSPVEVESFNASGSRNGISLALFGDTLYLGREDGSDPEFYVLDIDDPEDIEFEGSLHYADDLERLVASSGYVYAATERDTQELAIFDVSDEDTPVQVGGLDVSGNLDGQAIGVSGNLLALGRDNGTGPEFTMIDVSNPSSPILLGSAEVSDEISGLAMEGTSFVHLATDVNGQQYQRFNITTPSSPVLQTSLDLGADGEGVFFNGVYAFVGTEDNSRELQIVGPGSPPSDYAREGNFTSQAFDAGSDVSWDSIEWTSSATGSINFRIRTADTQAHLSTASWVGADGTPATLYSTWGGAIRTDSNATGRRWFQWKAYLTGNGSTTPSLEDVTIRYSQ